MASRRYYTELWIREAYGAQPFNDANLTDNLANAYINAGIGLAIKQNYKDAIQLDGIAYVNNSFYTTYTGLSVVADEQWYKVVLPSLPVGVGKNEGIAVLKFKSSDGKLSKNCIFISANQKGYFENMRDIPNKIIAYPEGVNVFVKSPIILTTHTANATILSGSDTNLDSELNVPADYLPIIQDYVMKILMRERSVPKVVANDGVN